tara:strand:- start:10 stop:1734 length:1725 start_codon:yes stop_codon:yes gene_type:complete
MKGLLGDMWDGVSNFLGKPKIATPERIKPTKDDPYGLMSMVANAGQDSEVFRKNIIPNTIDIGEGLLQIARDPMTAAKDATNVTMGAIGSVLPEGVTIGGGLFDYDNTENVENVINTFDSVLEKLSTADGRRDVMLQNPVDFLFGAFALASGASKLSKIAPSVKQDVGNVLENIELKVSDGMDRVEAFAIEVDKAFPDAFGGVPIQKIILQQDLVAPGVSDNIKKLLTAGYGQKRKSDESIRESIRNGSYVEDFKKTGEKLEEKEISLRDYADRTVIFPMADASATGRVTNEVGGFELAKGVLEEGGIGFGNAAKNKGLAWANMETAMPAFMNNLKETSDLGLLQNITKPPLIMPWQLGGGAINFSVQMSDTMVQAARANLTDAEMSKIDDVVRTQKYLKHFKDKDGNKIKPSEHVLRTPNFVGLKKVDLTDLSGAQRIALIKTLDTQAKDKIGSMLQHQLANADHSQLSSDPFTVHNVMQSDPSKGILDTGHQSYNKGAGGEFLGRMKEKGVSMLDLMPVTTKAGKPITTETIKTNIAPQNKSIMGQKLGTVITEEIIDNAINNANRRQGLLL